MQVDLVPIVGGAGVVSFLMIVWYLLRGIKWTTSNRAKLIFLFWRVIGRFTKRWDKSTVAKYCEPLIEEQIQQINKENPEAVYSIAEIKFSKSAPEMSTVEDGQVFIVLRGSDDAGENVLRVAEEYVRLGVMPKGRYITDGAIQEAVRVTFMSRLCSMNQEALRKWRNRHYLPCLEENETVDALGKTGYIDEYGYLMRVFLPQLELVGLRTGIEACIRVVPQTKEWLRFVHSLATKCDSDKQTAFKDVDLILREKDFGVGVVLVAKSFLVSQFGIEPHKGWVKEYLSDDDLSEIFIMGHGAENCYDALRVVGETYTSTKIQEVWGSFYRVKSRGRSNVPVVITRYIKGAVFDKEKKYKFVTDFLSRTRSELPYVDVRWREVGSYLTKHSNKFFGGRIRVGKHEFDKIARVLNRYRISLKKIDEILQNDDLNGRLENLLTMSRAPEKLYPFEQCLYKIHAWAGASDSKIIDEIDHIVFRNHAFHLEEGH